MSPESIIAAVAAVTEVPVAAITGKRRSREISLARFLAIAAIRKTHTCWTLQQTAGLFNRRDHATIIHAASRHSDLLATEPHYTRLWSEVLEDINPPAAHS